MKPILGYGFRVFIKKRTNLYKLNTFVSNYNNHNKSNVILNIEDNKFNYYGQSKIFVGFDKLKTCYLNSIKNDEIISYNKDLKLSITNNEHVLLSNLHKEVSNMGLILDDKLSWSIYNYE